MKNLILMLGFVFVNCGIFSQTSAITKIDTVYSNNSITKITTIVEKVHLGDYPSALSPEEARLWNNGRFIAHDKTIQDSLLGFFPINGISTVRETSWLKGKFEARERNLWNEERSWLPGIFYLVIFFVYGISLLFIFNSSKNKISFREDKWAVFSQLIIGIMFISVFCYFLFVKPVIIVSLCLTMTIGLLLYLFILLAGLGNLFDKGGHYFSKKLILGILQVSLGICLIMGYLWDKIFPLSYKLIFSQTQKSVILVYIAVCLILPVIPVFFAGYLRKNSK
jgi:tryptophan-rich sensory protein